MAERNHPRKAQKYDDDVRQPSPLKAPFPYFGGKSRVADVVWNALGDVDVYCEPFFGSGAVLLARPHQPRREIINDADGFVANFWRAVKLAPRAVARHADWPSNETDLVARHRWLCQHARKQRFLDRMLADPKYFSAEIAGRWVWTLSQWIGGGCCDGTYHKPGDPRNKGTCINGGKIPRLNPNGIFSISRRDRVEALFDDYSKRFRHTIVACGDWARVCGNAGLPPKKLCGLFLDPPYAHDTGRDCTIYNIEKAGTDDVERYCRDNGTRRNLRIVLAGFEGEYKLPGWRIHKWTRSLAYARSEQARANLARERLWFSPHCLN